MRLKIKVSAVVTNQLDGVINVLRAVASEREGICALTTCAGWDLGEADHVGVDDGESEMEISDQDNNR